MSINMNSGLLNLTITKADFCTVQPIINSQTEKCSRGIFTVCESLADCIIVDDILKGIKTCLLKIGSYLIEDMLMAD